jgi:hypothetical protein
MPLLARQLTPEGLLYIESGAKFDAGAAWRVNKQGRASAVHYQLLKPTQND